MQAGRVVSRPAEAEGWSLAAARREAVFPPKNETEQRKRATLTDKGKEKQKAELSCCPPQNMLGKLGSWKHFRLGQWARAAWSCGAVGLLTVSPSPAQHRSAQEGEKGPCNRLWALGNPQQLPCPCTLSHLLWEHNQHLPSPGVLPSSTFRTLRAPELSLPDAQDLPESLTAPDPLHRACLMTRANQTPALLTATH